MMQKTFILIKRMLIKRIFIKQWGLPLSLGLIGLLWLGSTWGQSEIEPFQPQPTSVATRVSDTLSSGTVATMNSPIFDFGPGWAVSKDGADPSEPADPWGEPAGVFTFEYVGTELALEVAVGDYWGYLFVTVDDQPANLLPTIAGNRNSQNQPAAYKTFYEPEKAIDGRADTKTVSRWIRVHRARNSATTIPATVHHARVEVWRGWGQTPIRGVAVDALPAEPPPLWPGILALVLAIASIVWQGSDIVLLYRLRATLSVPIPFQFLRTPPNSTSALVFSLASFFTLLYIATAFHLWWLSLIGLALLTVAALSRPALWIAALLFGLPFYYSVPVPILPNRAISLIDIGVLGGLVVCLGNWLLRSGQRKAGERNIALILWVLWAIAGWALVSTFAADHFAVALREWRVLFLNAALFALLLRYAIKGSEDPERDLWLLIGAWLAGGTVVALIGLGQYVSGIGITQAEGVRRIQALYDSPNNLALYLERTLAVSMALALFLHNGRWRWLAAGMALFQGVALLLTFSKGAIFLALPTVFVLLWIGGLFILKKRGESPKQSRRVLWWLAAVALVGLLALMPFVGTERFQRLLDFSQGTGYLRIQLWRSAWQMALDHPLLGVGPDNFLYTFRSGYILPTAWQEPNLNHPHNFFLDWWTRLGLPGLVLGVTFFALGLRTIWREIWRGENAALGVGLLAASVAALAHGLIDVSYALPDLLLVWVLIFVPITAQSPRYSRQA